MRFGRQKTANNINWTKKIWTKKLNRKSYNRCYHTLNNNSIFPGNNEWKRSCGERSSTSVHLNQPLVFVFRRNPSSPMKQRKQRFSEKILPFTHPTLFFNWTESRNTEETKLFPTHSLFQRAFSQLSFLSLISLFIRHVCYLFKGKRRTSTQMLPNFLRWKKI